MYPEFPENWGNGGSYTAVQPDGAPRPSDVQLSSGVAWGSQWGVGGQDLSPLPDSTFLTEAMTRVRSHRVRLTQSDGAPRPSDIQRSSDVAWGSRWGVGGQDLSPLPKSIFLFTFGTASSTPLVERCCCPQLYCSHLEQPAAHCQCKGAAVYN